MKVSAIVTTYNRSHFLRQTVDAVLNQTFGDFELIIVDNDSTDDTEAVVKSYADERIRYFKHQNNGIIAVNRNYGIARARGEYIAFCDDDDLWMPEKLARQVEVLDGDAGVGLVCANGINFDETGDLRRRIQGTPGENAFSFESLLHTNLVSTCTAMVRKAALERVGLFDESPELFAVEDYELWLRLAREYKVKYIDSPLGRYRIHRGGHSKRGAVDGVERDRVVFKQLLAKGILSPELFRRRMRKLNHDAAVMRFLVRTRMLGPALLIVRTARRLGSLTRGSQSGSRMACAAGQSKSLI